MYYNAKSPIGKMFSKKSHTDKRKLKESLIDTILSLNSKKSYVYKAMELKA